MAQLKIIQIIKGGWFERVFGPQHPKLFHVRIRARVTLLRNRTRLRAVQRINWLAPWLLLPRPVQVVLIGLLIGYCLYLWLPREPVSTALNSLMDPQAARSRLEWREVIQVAIILLGLPIAFLLWMYRDQHIHATLDNQRKDVTLKEFQEIQMRAAGALDERLPARARETLQVAALHQLRGFLRGEHGETFRRPAFELLRARFEAGAEEAGTEPIMARAKRLDRLRDRFESLPSSRIAEIVHLLANEQESSLDDIVDTPLTRADSQIMSEEWEALILSGFPLAKTKFHRMDVPEGAVLCEVDLSFTEMIGANLSNTHLELSDLNRAQLQGADLSETHLEKAYLAFTHLEGAALFGAHLELCDASGSFCDGAYFTLANLSGASFRDAQLNGAYLDSAKLSGADLRFASLRAADLSQADLSGAILDGANLEGADLTGVDVAAIKSLSGATFDSETRFSDPDEDRADELVKAWHRRLLGRDHGI